MKKSGPTEKISVDTSGSTIEFKAYVGQGYPIAEVIRGLMAAPRRRPCSRLPR